MHFVKNGVTTLPQILEYNMHLGAPWFRFDLGLKTRF